MESGIGRGRTHPWFLVPRMHTTVQLTSLCTTLAPRSSTHPNVRRARTRHRLARRPGGPDGGGSGCDQELAGACSVPAGNPNPTGRAPAASPAYLAALLVSVPERAAACAQPGLRPDAFVPRVVAQLLDVLAGAPGRALDAPAEACGRGGGSAAQQGALEFAGQVLSRLSLRGFAAPAAQTLWRRLAAQALASDQQGDKQGSGANSDAVAAALGAVDEGPALERLLEALLLKAGAASASVPVGVGFYTGSEVGHRETADAVAARLADVMTAAGMHTRQTAVRCVRCREPRLE